MDNPQRSFLGDDAEERAAGRDLVVRAQPGRPLSKAQKAFNRLVATVEKLRTRLQNTTRRLDEALAFHAQHVRPRRQRVTALRRDVVRALRPFLGDRRLKRRDRQVLRTIILEHVEKILDEDVSIDDELRGLLEELHGGDLAEFEEQAMQEAREGMEVMFAAAGLHVDLSGFHPGMSDEEAAAKVAELEDQVRRQADEARSGGRPGPRPTTRKVREDERIRQAEELRKGAIGTIYRRLAKVLHPDLEPDAEMRQRKSALMQELTAAYASHDLHTLLRLELEWIHHEETDVARLTDEKLGAYNQILKEQVAHLHATLIGLAYEPRYQPLVGLNGLLGTAIRFDDPVRVQALDAMIADLGDTLAQLQMDDALQEVREVIRARRTANRGRS